MGLMKLLKILPLVLIFVGVLVLFERPAYGYTDPGTGLLAVQAAGSALVATGWYLRRKIYSIFHRDDQVQGNPEEQSGITQDEASPHA
jgi:drug/metabolite transporter (DMT)-like permease